ncbi:DUF221-domain-containing protein [Polychaeton citri CBS 116435]|uniref:DUF221-domain-containing protein n=1 Tax=Polychaeton citri CBS 116435 TaxID=1314669 RepID=A0A9P4PX15_9PEZI|nr:DUF221-domain-containing protein [Polychaeton citri CBS 116435]
MAGFGGHRSEGSISGASILAAFIPTLIAAIIYLSAFVLIRNRNRKIYLPRTFLGTVPEKDRTPSSHAYGRSWFHDFKALPDHFVLQHNSLDAFLWLRFLKFVILICLIGCLLTWPILMPINATGGGRSTQLDRISFSNIAENNRLWAHVAVAWAFFSIVILLIARERLHVVGARQAYLLDERRALLLSSRTVLFLNVPREAIQAGNLESTFGRNAERSWPVQDFGDLEELIATRTGVAHQLESFQMDLIKAACKQQRKQPSQDRNIVSDAAETERHPTLPKALQQTLPLAKTINEAIMKTRDFVSELTNTIDRHREAPSRNLPNHSAVFVSFSTQLAAHRAFEKVTFKPRLPTQMRFLSIQPKEVLWKNLTMPAEQRLSKAFIALVFVIVFIIFFSIPVGIIGTISNVEYLAQNFKWLSWINNLPPWILGLLTGFVPPFLVSWFTSYVPKLFRHIAKLSGEPTTPQAELKTQVWTFVFQVAQVFLVTTFSSGASAIAKKTVEDPLGAPALLAEALPKASNFYLTYFILQGIASAADNVLNYSDLFSYWFSQYYWNKTPREKFTDYAQMKGMSWGAWYPKFTNLFVIAIAYSCIAPLVLGFAAAGIFLYYLSYRYNVFYVMQTKVDTRGEAYTRALKQMPTGIYLAELCLIGLMGARKAAAQSAVMIALLVVTAVVNGVLDRMLRPLELYLGHDSLTEQEVPLLAQEDSVSAQDEEALHTASHIRRLGINLLPRSRAEELSRFLDSIITGSRKRVKNWMHDSSARHTSEDAEELPQMSEEELTKAYTAPAFTSKIPKLWLPKDPHGVSKQIIEENDEVGIPTTDEGAWLDEKGRLGWDKDFDHVPVYSKPKII